MSQPICFFAFRSPYSRLGLHKLARAGLEPELHPFFGPPEGVAFANPTDNAPKRAYYAHDVLRLCLRMGLPITLPEPFDVDFAPANRVFFAARREGAGMAFALAVSDARWGEGRNVSELGVLDDCAAEVGLAGLVERAAARDIDEDMRAARGLTEAHGVFGVPFLIADGQPWWGQDRFDLYLETLKA
ncbi:MAG: DsbA family protein [Pseudomonadota bacterium]